MSKIEVNTVEPQCGTTLTLGASGDTVQLGTGASQSGFGRQGSVNWQTSIKTADFTAVSGEGYFINTTSGTITMTLPSSPSVGDIVAIKDYANTFDTNNLTIGRNGSNISGQASDGIISVEGQALTLVYGDATKGWQSVAAATEADLPKPAFVTATGGTITTVCTNFKVHTFTGPGTFCVSCAGNSAGSNQVDYLVIAGGGGGGGGYQSGGGGAGGYRESPGSASGCYTVSPRGAAPATAITVTAQAYPIVVGGGGPGGPSSPDGGGGRGRVGTVGNNSSALGIQSAGGGFGATFNNNTPNNANELGGDGGSGGGSGRSPSSSNPGGCGNSPPVNPVQGTNGGTTSTPYAPPYSGAGGGGALVAGTSTNAGTIGTGGGGATSSINGTPTARAGGGAGGGPGTGPYTGGTGGGGNGGEGPGPGGAGSNGTANTGSGGGGAGYECQAGGNGGGGIVIIRYKFQ